MRRISDYDDFYEAPTGLGGALELRDFGEEANSWLPNRAPSAGSDRRGGQEFAQARLPARRGTQPRDPVQEAMGFQIGRLMREIKRLNPNETFLEPAGGSYSVQARDSLQRRLEELQRAYLTDQRTGWPIQRFIGDSRGNIMFEPLGGRTVPGQNPVDTHTLYPNGSNYHRLNPQGHGPRKTPHTHGHLEGRGPYTSGQGPSLDVLGNIVPWNSPDAHWPMR
ncbi:MULTISPECIES: hypothetical protein [unclassified Ensifer]|uniref:hypothetical protein n=1 Tax=unclassified Ensifer TaxID=2633371 RepID=UPI000812E7E3|nr:MULTISPECIES: hypothetical protein [unclassified Ensifer]OCP17801.1 hypothetical protein BC361_10355 [Ensifer sp. LC54]OCP28293.1 hypothetical protein BC363_00010 [Ensifer sp. LC384]OCP38639.1 hypothetical protein BC360_00790 [Ensifer sp. LC163]